MFRRVLVLLEKFLEISRVSAFPDLALTCTEYELRTNERSLGRTATVPLCSPSTCLFLLIMDGTIPVLFLTLRLFFRDLIQWIHVEEESA
jgi:hypothetical protein